jgi:hypothetical protein
MNPALTVSGEIETGPCLETMPAILVSPSPGFYAGKFTYSIEHSGSLPASDWIPGQPPRCPAGQWHGLEIGHELGRNATKKAL